MVCDRAAAPRGGRCYSPPATRAAGISTWNDQKLWNGLAGVKLASEDPDDESDAAEPRETEALTEQGEDFLMEASGQAPRHCVSGGRAIAQSGSAPEGWSMKKTQVPSGSLRCTSMP
jgi:hypothetical protein